MIGAFLRRRAPTKLLHPGEPGADCAGSDSAGSDNVGTDIVERNAVERESSEPIWRLFAC